MDFIKLSVRKPPVTKGGVKSRLPHLKMPEPEAETKRRKSGTSMLKDTSHSFDR